MHRNNNMYNVKKTSTKKDMQNPMEIQKKERLQLKRSRYT